MKLAEAIEVIAPHLGDAVVVLANGYISRAGHGLCERERNFYMIGSMGLGSSIALGVALAQPERKVVVFDGDGNVLMNLGGLATVATQRPANFHHLVFDNEVYASTGNQPTQSSQVDLAEVARATGYAQVGRSESLEDLRAVAAQLMAVPGPSFHLIKIEREEGTAFDRVVPTPEEMTQRLRGSLA